MGRSGKDLDWNFSAHFGFLVRRSRGAMVGKRSMPMLHAEDPAIQRRAVEKFWELAEAAVPAERESYLQSWEYAKKHAAIIESFGRFPHRNRILERESTEEEVEFLKQPGSSFF
ncbi:MAG TPA: hypothetical protein DF383_10130 [Deltaproteobacteria bacterium]|nr:hypothetical protein [Deltaproteobacteria bacterium]